jgi:tol-pal system protein YbgF
MRRVALLGCLVLALPAPSRAANKDIERLQLQIAALQGQLAELQRAAELGLRETRRLNEQLAEQNALFQRALADQRQKDEAISASLRDISERLAEVAERFEAIKAFFPAGGGEPSPETIAAGTEVPAPRELYTQAYADFARGNYDLAIQGFTAYIATYPETDFTDNAQYWIGECLYGKKEYEQAIEAWNVLFRDHASSDKVPDGRVKKGMALERLGRRSQALAEYRLVLERFPESAAARIARERLSP